MRIGVYVCHCGGNISEVVDVSDVASAAGERPPVVLARDHSHMCSEAGQNLVLNDIKEHELDRVVVAACSPQFHEKTFRSLLERSGLSPYLLEMANIREHCSWPHFTQPRAATEKAKNLTDAAVAKVRRNRPLKEKTMPIGKRVLVVGAGIAGIQASLDLGDAGFDVTLVEKEPTIGGKMARLSRTFPTEDCAACILSPKMADVPANSNITLYTNSEVENIDGYLGNYEVTIKERPRYVNEDSCVACGICGEKCPTKVPNEFNQGLDQRKAIYLPCDLSVPYKYLIDGNACLYLNKGTCRLCEKVCPHDAVDFQQRPERIELTVDTIIVATGYDTFDARKKKVYGYGEYENVITGLEMERVISSISEGTPLREIGDRIGFIQCVGSRDERVGNEYCSRICCMYATKLAQLVKRADPGRDVYVFYTDLRATGKGGEEYYKRAQREGVKYIRGRVAEATEEADTKRVTLRAEDTLSREILEMEFDLVVLSTGLVPNEGTGRIAGLLKLSESADGFLKEAHLKFKPVDTLSEGVFICGCAQGPKDIPDTVAQASGAAARAMRLMNMGEYPMNPMHAFLVDQDICSGCEACIAVCPFNAIEKEDGRIRIIEVLCKGCGACVGICRNSAIQQKGFRDDQIVSMIDAALEEVA